MDLSNRIRVGLANGKPPEEIASELIASGMTEATARRLVDRAATQPPPPEVTAGAEGGVGHALDSGRVEIIAGALLASLGVAVTVFTYIRAQPGQSYIVAYGLAIGGLVMLGKGINAWLKAGARNFPEKATAVAAVLPFVVFFVPLGWTTWRESTREERELAARIDAEESATAAERDAKERALQKRIGDFQAETGRAVQALQMLIDGNPATRCAGARILGEQKLVEPIGELERVAGSDPDQSVRNCATTAIASIKNANPDAFRPRPY